ncbi:NuoM family protein [Sulfurihydrogenibium azorense]|uniref:NADH-quinone oxidoreductase subunit m (Nadhdehydrogenase i subunit m) (Ndh-1 subunit m) n=1 Tax=Sulfurihydrogenibium azorense (strain DSM 15241 / OCM 825 / Az-Fu1) TaxID=204536 RepID=C1DT37_SULAA|nr:NADH-quinone oxidoreductase subunit M [Sulfurihydrogenibium azorense]ACN99567.1 NADH-quinone oxidoreductase subunit m (nadhdehydrogenase i subunit m) (ndh-1 subunit m) [Sulfurihydrogenibium azorense Az-Fu1]MDM7273384.1 NADH-quinone oxidoreductase subunit M [Sulfurihydrogenibium azorense]
MAPEFVYAQFPLISISILIPLIAAAIVFFTSEKLAKPVSIVSSIIVFIIASYMLLTYDPSGYKIQFYEKYSWIPQFGINYEVGVDALSLTMVWLTAISFVVAFIWSTNIEKRIKEYFVAFLVLEAACIGVFVAWDLVAFYVFWEVMLIPMFLIIGVWGYAERIYAATKFFIYTFFGSLFLLIGVIGMYIYNYMENNVLSMSYFDLLKLSLPHNLEIIFFLLLALGFAIKVPMWPFHTWLPAAHVQAPTAGSVILAAVLLKMGTYGFVRFNLPWFPEASKYFVPVMFALGVIAIIYTAMMAIAQTHIKRLIAYSSVSHMGFVTIGTFALNTEGVNGAIITMISHGLTSGALFLAAGFIYERLHSYEMKDLGGMAKFVPVFATLFMISAMASAGLPGLSGFVGEFLALLGTFKVSILTAALAGLSLVVGAAYTLWLYKRTMFEEELLTEEKKKEYSHLKDLNTAELWSFLPLVIFMFVIGIYPKWWIDLINNTTTFVLHKIVGG